MPSSYDHLDHDRAGAPAGDAPADATPRVSEASYRQLVESVSDYAIIILDPEGHVLSWNKGAERFKGYRADEIIGQSSAVFYTPGDRARQKPRQLLDTALREGHVEDEGWRVRQDGSHFWADVVITPMYDAEGRVAGFSQVTRDLTERKRAEDQQRQFRLLVESVTDYAILMLSPQGRVVSWNRGAEALKGYTEAEILGEPYERFFLPADVAAGKPKKLLARALNEGHIEDEGWRVRKDGSRFWALAVITAIRDEDGTFIGYGKVTRDLTDRKRLEDLATEKAQLQAASKLKSEFLATMSHELRTPLNAIIGYTELVVTDETLRLDDQNADNLQTVLRSARHLLGLINEILDFSKIESGQLTIQCLPLEPQQTIRTVLSATRPLAAQKGLELELIVEPGVEHVVSDEMKLRQILINLVNNALKFTHAGGVTIRLAPKGEAHWTVSVSDTGIGIAPEHAELVFQEFRQVDASSTRQAGGTGLGLAISRKLADMLGGALTLESTLGAGSTFTLELPRQCGDRPAVPVPLTPGAST